MKPIIITLLLTCSIAMSAQVPTEMPSISKVQALTHNNVTLAELLGQNPASGINPDADLIAHWIDFDNDGDYDLITVAIDEDKSVCFFKNNKGKHQLVSKSTLDKVSISELNVMADFQAKVDIVWYDKNSDGYNDFFMSVNNSAYETEYLSNGDGTFQKISEYLAVN